MPMAAKVFGAKPKEPRIRLSARQRGYDAVHEATRLMILQRDKYTCKRCGRLASIADHIKPHKGDERLLRDPNNYQSLCVPCHGRKTVQEDGGFGNTVKRN